MEKVQFSKSKVTYMTNHKLETNDMEKYYLLPRKVTNNNKLREFQFKILHRYLATNSVLYKMKLTNTNTCTFCNIEIESIEHLFWECINVRNFWRQLEINLRESCGYNLTIEGAIDVLLGKLKEIPVVNLEIVCGKYFIYLCKLRGEIPEIKKYLVYRPSIDLIN